jgi:hypothetical protein
LAIIVLGGENYDIGRKFTIGQLRRMTDVVDAGGNVIDRSRQLVAIALERGHPDIRLDDEFETDMTELNAAAAVVIDIAGFVMVGKPRAVPAAA